MLLNATIIEGPFKGWPVCAAIMIQAGTPVADVKAAMLAQAEVQAKADADRIHQWIEEIKALPDTIVLQ